jgi:AcrR family transcriptional regulator/DNA-binding MarR family transcriptional regulator
MTRAKTGTRREALRARPRSVAGSVAVTPRVQVAEMQRARLLGAAVATFGELGYARASVAHITARARVSRRTFYDLFENREDCLLAVLQDAAGRIEGEIVAADLGGLAWRDRVRGGLLVVLSFFDREPLLARVCVVQGLQGGPRVLAWREETLGRLAGILDEGRGSRSRECTELMAEGLVGAAFAIVYSRLSSTALAGRGEASRSRTQGAQRTEYASDRGRRGVRPLVALLNELMSLIVLPYQGSAAARAEQQRALPRVSKAQRVTARGAKDAAVAVGQDPLRGVPMRLTYRTARVLEVVAEHPGASNRQVAEYADIADQGQVSKLLARLERLELMHNTGEGHAKGERNAWSLTGLGGQVARRLGASTDPQGVAA